MPSHAAGADQMAACAAYAGYQPSPVAFHVATERAPDF
jgi:hypothetical protein